MCEAEFIASMLISGNLKINSKEHSVDIEKHSALCPSRICCTFLVDIERDLWCFKDWGRIVKRPSATFFFAVFNEPRNARHRYWKALCIAHTFQLRLEFNYLANIARKMSGMFRTHLFPPLCSADGDAWGLRSAGWTFWEPSMVLRVFFN